MQKSTKKRATGKTTRHRTKQNKSKSLTRSEMMQAVHSENTKPEVIVRKALFKAGFRYRLHRRDLPGTPDIFIQKYGVAIFVNGCFWHQHGCKFTTRPKSNKEFWNNKFDNNIVRDIKTQYKLGMMGIRSATVWECSLSRDLGRANLTKNCANQGMTTEMVLERLIDFIRSDEETIEL